MSLRSNKLEFLPEEIGQMQKLRVLNLSDNRLKNLPFTFTKLKELAALWLSDNQSKALIPLQTEAHPETKQRVLTNYMFPQQPRNDDDFPSDSDSFNPTLWEEQRQQRMTVAFEFEDKKEEEEGPGKVKVEINLKRYPTPYPEDLKNMVKSVQNLVGKTTHPVAIPKSTPIKAIEHPVPDTYEHKWPIAPQEVPVELSQCSRQGLYFHGSQASDIIIDKDSYVNSPNELRMGELRPPLNEPPLYQPKLVILNKDKKDSVEEASAEKLHSANNSESSGSYSEYSPSQGSSASSNTPGKVSSLQTATKDTVNTAMWANRLTQSFPQPIETKPLLSQRDSAPVGSLQQRTDRHPLAETFSDSWTDGSHYDNTGFVSEEGALEASSSKPQLGPKSRSGSGHGRRPLVRQDRIVGIPLELEQPSHMMPGARNTPDAEVPPNPWQNWTRTPSPFEDRTAFPSKLDTSPSSSPVSDRRDNEQLGNDIPTTFSPAAAWGYDSSISRSHSNVFSQLQCRPEPIKSAMVISKSTERLAPMMRDVKASRFKKSQSIDEIDIGAFKVYNIPLENYGSGMQTQGHMRTDMPMMPEQGMSRSQSVPMLDEDLDAYGTGKGSQQKAAVTKKVYHFDQSFNPQGAVEIKTDRRVPAQFPQTADYGTQQLKNIPKELVSPRPYRGYPPVEHMFSFSQPSVNEDSVPPQFLTHRPRLGYLRRADSLASATEMALYRRVSEPQELTQTDRYPRTPIRAAPLEHQSSIMGPESQFLKRTGRYEDDYSSYQEMKNQTANYPAKTLTQRRPLSARSYSTESYGASQARPVSARPTMTALLEKIPSDYNLSNYAEKPIESTEVKMRPMQLKGDESSSKMPVDWRQQLLRHIEAKRLDRNAAHKQNTVNLGMLHSGKFSSMHAGRSMTLNLHSNSQLEHQKNQTLPLQQTPSQQSSILDNGQEDLSPSSQWNPYPLGRRDVPPDSIIKKAGSHIQTVMGTASQSLQHRAREQQQQQQQQYEGAMNKVSIQQYQSPLPIPISSSSISSPRGAQPGRSLIQTKGQRSLDGYQEQFCVRIDKNPGLGFSISGGLSGQGNPFKPSDMGIFVTRVQPDGPAANILQPGDKIIKANGHSFVHMEHEKAVSLLKSFQNTVDLVIQREITA
ncbi:leucine-rich repeat-containing protein 7-like [Protopterus annectens]|uniref:leucine-rich repeat-containing protein 7-like n=1 Tax=Protopterus annectens TaxID=7888 RepID=UPI001CFADB47|nr:leucine-rich repeat-containing protein 7-like [Protopterus annectens]